MTTSKQQHLARSLALLPSQRFFQPILLLPLKSSSDTPHKPHPNLPRPYIPNLPGRTTTPLAHQHLSTAAVTLASVLHIKLPFPSYPDLYVDIATVSYVHDTFSAPIKWSHVLLRWIARYCCSGDERLVCVSETYSGVEGVGEEDESCGAVENGIDSFALGGEGAGGGVLV